MVDVSTRLNEQIASFSFIDINASLSAQYRPRLNDLCERQVHEDRCHFRFYDSKSIGLHHQLD